MEPLASPDALLAATDGDAFVRWGPATVDHRAWWHRGVVMLERRGPRRGFWVLAPATLAEADVRSALVALRDGGRLEGALSLSIDRHWYPVLAEEIQVFAGGDWDWMWTRDEPPALPGETDLRILDDATDADLINTFSAEHNQRVWSPAGEGKVVHWLGLFDEHDRLVAVGGSELEDSGFPHLVGIVSHSEQRGRGLGRLISTALTRWALVECGVSTLGVYADNDPARHLYDRLGYRLAHAWASRRLRDPASVF